MKTIFLSLSLLTVMNIQAATVKIGVLAPEGTGWAKNIKKMTTEIKEATKGNVDLKVYYGFYSLCLVQRYLQYIQLLKAIKEISVSSCIRFKVFILFFLF